MNEKLDMIKDIPRYIEWKEITMPEWGWSINDKFKIIDNSNQEYILRVSSIIYYDEKKCEYESIVRLSKFKLNMPMPIEFGICNNGKSVYLLLTWVDGISVQDVIKTLDNDLQYEYGVKSGQLLKDIHDNSKINTVNDWEYEYGKNIDNIITDYYQTRITINHERAIIDYITKNKHLLNNQQKVIRHGDYHLGNLIIMPNKNIGVIDFDKCRKGDGWEEFGGIVWAVRLSTDFARGQVDGYFDKQIPEKFFKLLALYIGVYSLEHVVRSVNHHTGRRNIDDIMYNTDFMASMFDNFNTYIPNWYNFSV